MHSKGLVIEVDHPVFGTSKGTAFEIDKMIVSLGTFLIPLFFPERKSVNNNNTNDESSTALVLFKDFIRQINTTSIFDSYNNNEQKPEIQFKIISEGLNPKNIKLCLLHTYTKLSPENNLNWNSCENTDDVDYYKLILDASQLFMFFTTSELCKTNIKNTLSDIYDYHKNNVIYPGLPILVESTPFVKTSFLNSWSHGIVSKILEHESGGIVTDARLVHGCEGAPIYT